MSRTKRLISTTLIQSSHVSATACRLFFTSACISQNIKWRRIIASIRQSVCLLLSVSRVGKTLPSRQFYGKLPRSRKVIWVRVLDSVEVYTSVYFTVDAHYSRNPLSASFGVWDCECYLQNADETSRDTAESCSETMGSITQFDLNRVSLLGLCIWFQSTSMCPTVRGKNIMHAL